MSCSKSRLRKSLTLEKINVLLSTESAETKSFKSVALGTDDDEEDSVTETCSSISTTPENKKCDTAYENDDSDYSDYDTDDSCQEFTLKDWLKLAMLLVRKQETPKNKNTLAGKSDELQDFFYFFAVEYFHGDQNKTELVSSKRNEFMMGWQDVISGCDSIFELLLDLMDNINAENSFRL